MLNTVELNTARFRKKSGAKNKKKKKGKMVGWFRLALAAFLKTYVNIKAWT